MYLEIADVKRHLYIDHNDDDMYLADLITVAEDAVKTDLNLPSLSVLENREGMLPSSVIHAMLLLIGTLYSNRESVSFGTPHKVPLAYEYLLDLNRCYYRDTHKEDK